MCAGKRIFDICSIDCMTCCPLKLQCNGMLYKLLIKSITRSSDPPPLFKEGGVNFSYLPQHGGLWKIKKAGGSMVQGQVFLKGEGRLFPIWFFSSFIIFTFRNYFTLCKIALHNWRKKTFFCHHNFVQKSHSKLSKNEPEKIQ